MAKKATSPKPKATGRKPNGRFDVGNKIGEQGRPPMFKTPKQLEEKVIEYFQWIQGEYEIKEGIRTITSGKGEKASVITETYEYKFWHRSPETPSITGLAIFLGFESRQSMYDYMKKDGFSYSIKKALLKVENAYESGLWQEKPTGVIFALKNMGWVDKSETKLSGDNENPLAVVPVTGMIIK